MTGECTCLPYCAGGYGPEEDCPVHGEPDPCRTCGRDWGACLAHSEFCCGACSHPDHGERR